MRPRSLLVAALTVVVVLQAGCTGLPGQGTPAADGQTGRQTATATAAGTTSPPPEPTRTRTPTPTPGTTPTPVTDVDDHVAVDGGPLPVNATLVLERVEAMLEVDVEAPTVVVRNESGSVPGVQPTRVQRLFGATDTSERIASCGSIAGGSAGGDTVTVSVGGLDAQQVELLLVHEYLHVVQHQVEGFDAAHDETRRGIPSALMEGGAVYATDVYARRHGLSWDGKRPLELRACFYRRSGDGLRDISARYYFAARHFEQRLDGSPNLTAVYTNPPRTQEQLLDGLRAGSEPVAALEVTTLTGDRWRIADREHRGELSLRTLLASTLTGERAAAAADGWGESFLVELRDGTETGVAWTVRFDTRGEADEFANAFADYESVVERERNATVRLVRVAPETVVLLAGSASFVDETTVSGTNGNVTVEPPA